MLSHAGHRGHGNRRKCSIRLRQRQQFIDAAYALGGDNTELGKVAAQGVDSHRALLDQQFTGLVQHQNGLLVVTLDRYEAHIRSHCGLFLPSPSGEGKGVTSRGTPA